MHRPEGFGPSCLSSIAFSRYQLAMSDETAPTYCESKVRAGPNLAVKDGVLDGQLGERPLERLKSKVPLIARNQLRLAVLQERDRPKTVVFQFENVIGMVEGLPHQTEAHGVDARDPSLSLRLWMSVPPLVLQ